MSEAVTTSQTRELLRAAGLDPRHWNVTAATRRANRWIAGNETELAEGGDPAEFGTLSAVDFLQQCVAETATVSDELYFELWGRAEADEFAAWAPVWTAA